MQNLGAEQAAVRQDECSQRMSGGKKRIKFILFRKAGKTILSRNIARLGTRGELTSEILQDCAGHII